VVYQRGVVRQRLLVRQEPQLGGVPLLRRLLCRCRCRISSATSYTSSTSSSSTTTTSSSSTSSSSYSTSSSIVVVDNVVLLLVVASAEGLALAVVSVLRKHDKGAELLRILPN